MAAEEENVPSFRAMDLDALIDKATYDFRYVVSGFIGDQAANSAIRNLAHFNEAENDPFNTGRGDCVALCDVLIDKAGTVTGAPATASKYAAYFAPSFCIKEYAKKIPGVSTEYKDNVFPASFYYLACAKKARLNNFDE